jgi:hypothetical protein
MNAPTSPPTKALREQLNGVLIGIRRAQSAAAVSALALQQQQAERDADVASVLSRSVVDEIEFQVEQLESVLEALLTSGSGRGTESESNSNSTASY